MKEPPDYSKLTTFDTELLDEIDKILQDDMKEIVDKVAEESAKCGISIAKIDEDGNAKHIPLENVYLDEKEHDDDSR